jgi:hypothetical protein
MIVVTGRISDITKFVVMFGLRYPGVMARVPMGSIQTQRDEIAWLDEDSRITQNPVAGADTYVVRVTLWALFEPTRATN